MEYAYDINGAIEPIVRPVQIYNATSLSDGALMMLGTTDPDSNADHGVAYVVAATASSAEAIDALGILVASGGATNQWGGTETVTNLPDVNAAPYGNCIINPGAVYLAEYDQADTMAVASTSTTTITVTSLEDDIDIGWIFTVTTSVTGDRYNLRQLTASASGSATMDSALAGGNETSGTAIKILPTSHKFTKLNSAGTGIGTDAAVGAGVALVIVSNLVGGSNGARIPLRSRQHRGYNGDAFTRLYGEIAMLDHVYTSLVS